MKPVVKKYRVMEYRFPKAKRVYVTQYKILGMWLSVDKNLKGHIITWTKCFCETRKEARDRMYEMIRNSQRISEWNIAEKFPVHQFTYKEK